ncbi:hypothetical protein SAMN06272781_1257 [Streptomyces sp. 1222.2]|uniref:Uncharacterized protein n=1 Tax=Streptomyces stelliscabiei TaxID=146820 RepID=A0A8I0PGD1_9ACTN|nr:hypothetical protein [Streptomyces stelliscabiei]SOD67880.1 hypothetical protein SAMN06272781_1257 [Streptomyces sp. 1222.2]
MPPFLFSTDTPAGCADSSAHPIWAARNRLCGVPENSALGHVLRRLVREAQNPIGTASADFESSLEYEAPV